MNSNFKPSTLYNKEYVYTAKDGSLNPPQIIFKSLSKRDIDFIQNLDKDSKNNNNVSIIVLEKSLLKFTNMFNDRGEPLALNPELLPINLRNTLVNLIMEMSLVTEEIIASMKLNIKLAMEDKFTTNTWNCKICQEKEIDKQRNCKFRADYDEIYINDFILIVGDEEYDHCPMYYKDNSITSDMFSCYSYFNKGILPDVGALVDQTEFFQHSVSLISEEVSIRQDKALNENS